MAELEVMTITKEKINLQVAKLMEIPSQQTIQVVEITLRMMEILLP